MNITTLKVVTIATVTFVTGVAIGGKVMYKKGLHAGAQKIYEAGKTMYPDFKSKMVEYANDI